MACGDDRWYHVEYDLKIGDVFKFLHRHRALHLTSKSVRKSIRRWTMTKEMDFDKEMIIVWTGDCWLTPIGNFKPTHRWWLTWVVHVEPIAISVPKRIKLRMWKQLR